MSDPLTGRTIRLYCDGELSADEAHEVERRLRQDPKLSAWVEFERRLRQRVALIMEAEGVPAPAALAERIRTGGDRGAGADRLEAQPTPAVWSLWRGPNRANIFAVAASLALVAGAVLFGILGPSIDSLRTRDLTNGAADAAAAVAGEHVQTTSMLSAIIENARFRSREEARRGLARELGPSLTIFDLSDLGYEFKAGDLCAVPHCEQGCHLVYYRSEGRRGLVTLHIVPDRGQFVIQNPPSGSPLPLGTGVIPEGAGCRKDVLVWNHGGCSYLLVVCIDEDVQPVATRMQEALISGGPSPRR